MRMFSVILLGIIGFSHFSAAEIPSHVLLRQKMVEYEAKKDLVEFELAKVQIEMYLLMAQNGHDIQNMDISALEKSVKLQKQYLLGREQLANQLSQIYVPTYVPKTVSVDVELQNALSNVAKRCKLFKKIISRCLSKKEALIYQSEYLKQRILAVETSETALLYEINSLIVQGDLATMAL